MIEQLKQQIDNEETQLNFLAQKVLKDIYRETDMDVPKDTKINFGYKINYDNIDNIDLPTQYSFNILFKKQDGKVCEPSFTIAEVNKDTLKKKIKEILRAYSLLE
jgi:translation elongation factor EF-1beta